jgi:glycosyltransferase involved in cell wall biosynthesis
MSRATDSSQTPQSYPLPSVSVIMAVYNAEQYLAEAIKSVLHQTHTDFEFIIVDDGSTDRTPEIIDWYAARDERIRVISQANMDQPASLNRALAAASNDWVAVMDADDKCMPHRLETQLRALQREPSVRVLGSYARRLDEQGRSWGIWGIRTVKPKSLTEYHKLIKRNELMSLVHPSVMMHRSTILAFGGYDTSFGPAADTELWSRVSEKCVVMSLPEPLIYYRVHSGSMTMRRFFEQRLMLRWLQARQHARRHRLPPPSLDEYRRSLGSRFALRRLRCVRQDWGSYLEMRSTLAWYRGHHLRALLIRAAASVLIPLQVARGLWVRKPSFLGRSHRLEAEN